MAKVSNPRKSFNFSVQIAQLPINPFLVQEIDDPEVEVEQVTHGDVNYDVKTPGRVKVGNGTMRKLQTTGGADNYMWDWLESCQDAFIGGGLVPDEAKRTFIINDLAEDGTSILNTYTWEGVWPTKINGLQRRRTSSDNSIEVIEFSVDRVGKI